ncbi:hypothetical protein ECANGB1_1171 [Enterospora canceri]|uniref:Uncharacterized protein n=1 Tax=Enterospora canceri TaxID=1081671 RepID=A0A1Y1S7U1_9MICR|nr:hypothetical protein ECANGB1_1171 [Enterospora canceri]
MSKRTERQEITGYTSCMYQISYHTMCLYAKMLLATKYAYQTYSTELEIIKNKNNSCVREHRDYECHKQGI